jgi:PAS domain S-box-containing protein
MTFHDLERLVRDCGDPAFATDNTGAVVAWNAAAQVLFGISARDAVGKTCAELVRGEDDCGAYCALNCGIRERVRRRQPIASYDLEVETAHGKRWCSCSVLVAQVDSSAAGHAVHLIRDIDVAKRLELTMKRLVAKEVAARRRGSNARSRSALPARETTLSARERQILQLIAKGTTAAEIAAQLTIARATLNNHVQHILQKLNAHTRLQAVRRAERAGIIEVPDP